MKLDKNTKVYIAGCGGMLGDAVYRRFSEAATVRATDIDLNEPWLNYADVRDLAAIERDIDAFAPDLIINLAALTDLELCEREQENSWLTNTLGAENLGLVANRHEVPYVYISTAGIFGGEKDAFNDFDAPNPLAIYAKSKAQGENWVLRSVQRHFIFRAGWMMGGGPRKDKKFVNKIYKQIKAGMTELFVVDDKLGTPTYTVDFAKGIQMLVESDEYGLYNQVCGGSGSRYDVAVAFVEMLGLHGRVKVTRVASDHFKTEYFAPRPASEKLVNLKLDARRRNVMRDWHVCLSEYADVYREDLATSR